MEKYYCKQCMVLYNDCGTCLICLGPIEQKIVITSLHQEKSTKKN